MGSRGSPAKEKLIHHEDEGTTLGNNTNGAENVLGGNQEARGGGTKVITKKMQQPGVAFATWLRNQSKIKGRERGGRRKCKKPKKQMEPLPGNGT